MPCGDGMKGNTAIKNKKEEQWLRGLELADTDGGGVEASGQVPSPLPRQNNYT